MVQMTPSSMLFKNHLRLKCSKMRTAVRRTLATHACRRQFATPMLQKGIHEICTLALTHNQLGHRIRSRNLSAGDWLQPHLLHPQPVGAQDTVEKPVGRGLVTATLAAPTTSWGTGYGLGTSRQWIGCSIPPRCPAVSHFGSTSYTLLKARKQRKAPPATLLLLEAAEKDTEKGGVVLLQTSRSCTFRSSYHVVLLGRDLTSSHRPNLAASQVMNLVCFPRCSPGSVPPAPVVPVQVQGRAFLPCSENPKLPKALDGPRDSFPYVLEPQSSAQDFSIQDWANACKMEMDENLAKYGAILFRGLPLSTPDDFGKWMRGLDWRTMGDKEALKCMFARSMSSHNINEMVRTASDDPAEYTIEPHSEYHTVGFPDKIFLWCEQPATHGGEWPCTDIRAVYRDLDPEVTKKFEELGVNYKVSYPCREKAHYNNWEDNISPDKEFVEHYLADQGYTWKWGDDNSLTYEQVFPVTKTHPKTGEKAWFNQIHAQHMTFYTNHPLFVNKPKTDTEGWPVDCSYGDGTPIPPAILDHIRETVWKHTIALGQEPGDLLVCDNLLVMHGRMGYSPAGSRKVYASVSYE